MANTDNLKRPHGPDLSTWQDDSSTPQHVDGFKAAAAGSKFAFIKATERLGIDADLVWNKAAFKAAGIMLGYYHFARPDVSALDQANFFWSVIKNDPGELPPVLDLEAGPIGTKSLGLSWVKVFMERISALAGRPAILYTSNGFWGGIRDSANALWILDYPLWIAWPVTSLIAPVRGVPDKIETMQPLIPEPWKRKGIPWRFWQYTWVGDGPFYGAESKGLDLNVFNGTEAELRAFAGLEAGEPTDPGDPGDPPVQPDTLEVLAWQLWGRSAPVYANGTKRALLNRGERYKLAGTPIFEPASGITWQPIELPAEIVYVSSNPAYVKKI